MEAADETWVNAKKSFIRHAKLSDRDREKIESCQTPADVARWTAEEYNKRFSHKKLLNETGRSLCLNAMQVALGSTDAQIDVAQSCPLLSSVLDRVDKVGRCLDIASNATPFAAVAWAGLKYFIMAAKEVNQTNEEIEKWLMRFDVVLKNDALISTVAEDLTEPMQIVRKLLLTKVLETCTQQIRHLRRSTYKNFGRALMLKSSKSRKSLEALSEVEEQQFRAGVGNLLVMAKKQIDGINQIPAQIENLVQNLRDDFSTLASSIGTMLPTSTLETRIKDWLQPTDEETILFGHEMTFSRYPDACSWYFTRTSYMSWEADGGTRNLGVIGGPGTGKSTLVARIINKLLNTRRDAHILYYFCRYHETTTSTVELIARSFLHQLSTHSPEVVRYLAGLVDPNSATANMTLAVLLQRVLLDALALLSPNASVFLIIDAMDELRASVEDQQRLLEFLSSVTLAVPSIRTNLPTIKCLITSQPQPGDLLRRAFRINMDLHYMEASDTRHDMEEVIKDSPVFSGDDEGKEQLLRGLKAAHHEITDIESFLTAKADGAFIWLKFVLDELQNAHTVEEMASIIEGYPQRLNDYYRAALSRLSTKLRPQERRYSQSILGWTILSRRPLTLDELRDAISGLGKIGNLTLTISKTCGPFLHIRENRVRAVHPSVARFFVSYIESEASDSLWLSIGLTHKLLALVCFDRLRLIRGERTSLVLYAAEHCRDHFTLCTELSDFSSEDFLSSQTREDGMALVATYQDLAEDEMSRSQFRDCDKLLDQEQWFIDMMFGRTSHEFADLLKHQGKTFMRQEKFKQAADLFEQRAELLKHLQTDNLDLAAAIVDIAQARELSRELQKGAELRRVAIEMVKAESSETITIPEQLYRLALNLEEQKCPPEATDMYQQSLAVCRNLGESSQALRWEVQEHFALFEERQGIVRSTLDTFQSIYYQVLAAEGPVSPETMIRKTFLACVTMDEEQNQEWSDRLWEEVITWKENKEGRTTTSMAALIKTWAWNCKKHERWDKARELAEDALHIAELAYKPNSFPICGHLMILGDIALGQGRMAVAEKLYLQGVEMHEDILGLEHPWTVRARSCLERVRNTSSLGAAELARRQLEERNPVHPQPLKDIRTMEEWRVVRAGILRAIYCQV